MGHPTWLLFLVLAGVARPAALRSDCKRCGGDGLADCPALARHACPPGSAALFCSCAAACPECEGANAVPCPRCKASTGAELAPQRAANRAWLAGVLAIDGTMGKELAHAQSGHFLLTYDIQKVDAKGGETLHGGLHLYLERLEQLHARFCGDLSVRDEDFLDRTHVLLWERVRDQEKASLAFVKQSSSTESKLMGKSPVVSIFYDQEWLHEEFELHQALVHQVTHCLLSNVFDGIWPGNIRAGWLDEGLAHAYEIALFGGVRHYCYVESDTILDLRSDAWESEVRAAVDRDRSPAFVAVAGKNTIELAREDQPYAWSYVDFLLRQHPSALGPLARSLKARKPLQEALAGTLALSPFEFEERWKDFVRERYSLKKPR